MSFLAMNCKQKILTNQDFYGKGAAREGASARLAGKARAPRRSFFNARLSKSHMARARNGAPSFSASKAGARAAGPFKIFL
jgi:hypothetical protein